jgi:heterotetrameric sarcosine oxidase gamma subunit
MTGKGQSCVASLIAKTPLAGRELVLGGVTLSGVALGRVTSVAPFRGQTVAVGALLGLGFPAPGRIVQGASHRMVWTGREQAFLFGAVPEGLADLAALTDQSDGWAGIALEGPGAADALMRLVPLDLRAAAFPPGQVARAPLNHMQAVLLRTGDQAFTLMVFRSMAESAWHELETVLRALAARAALPS